MRVALLSDMHGNAIEFRLIPFDVEELIRIARGKDFPGFERWSAIWQR